MSIIDRIFGKAIQSRVDEAVTAKSADLSYDSPAMIQMFPDVFGKGKGQKPALVNAYKTFAVVYACSRVHARNIGQCPFVIKSLKTKEPVENQPVNLLYEKPNLLTDSQSFLEGQATFLNTGGNVFIWKSKKVVRGGIPAEFTLLEIGRVSVWKDDKTGLFYGFIYNDGREKVKIPYSEMIHIKLWNPYDQVLGLSPLEAASLTLDSEWYAMKYNTKVFENDGVPPRTYILPNSVSDNAYDEFKKKVERETKGIEKRHKNQVLRGDIKITDYGVTQRDMDFLNQRKFTREEICMIMSTPKTELTLYEDVNYATALSQSKTFWENQLIPEMKLIANAHNRQFLNAFGYYGEFDLSKVPALQKLTADKAATFKLLLDTGVFKPNELIEVLDLPFKQEPWRDEEEEKPEPPAPGKEEKPAEDEETPPAAPKAEKTLYTREYGIVKTLEGPVKQHELDRTLRTIKWTGLRKGINTIERKCGQAVRLYFQAIEEKALKRATGKLKAAAAEVKDFMTAEEMDDLFDDERLAARIEKFLKEAQKVGGESILGKEWMTGSPEAQAALESRLMKVKVVNATARERIHETIRTAIKARIEGGLNEAEAEKMLISALKDDFRQLRGHAKTIARTETAAAYSDARMQAIDETEPAGLRWLSTRDENVRDLHADLDGEIAMHGVPFTASDGRQIQYPHDPGAEPDMVINCRCVVEPVYNGRGEGL